MATMTQTNRKAISSSAFGAGEPPRQRLAVRRVAAERIDDVHTVGSPRPVKAVAVAGR